MTIQIRDEKSNDIGAPYRERGSITRRARPDIATVPAV
jgi:hypothetical protein